MNCNNQIKQFKCFYKKKVFTTFFLRTYLILNEQSVQFGHVTLRGFEETFTLALQG